jgi:hypothetical protein
MQVFVKISSRGCFYYEELCLSAFIGWLEHRWAPFLPCSQLLPWTGSIQILSYTLQRWSLVPIGDQSLVAHPRCMLVHTSFVWGPVVIQDNHCSFPRPCIPILLRLQLRFATLTVYTFGSCQPRHTCPWQWVTPTGLITHYGNTGLGTLPPLLPQSIIDR